MDKWLVSGLTRAVLILFAVEVAVIATLSAIGSTRTEIRGHTRELNRSLVRELRLTDLALSSGTSYTRHPSQADFFAAHSDSPAAMEHFPAGSIVPPPASPDLRAPNTRPGALP
jgi:hypothetical protein